jgi:hypothetical protein
MIKTRRELPRPRFNFLAELEEETDVDKEPTIEDVWANSVLGTLKHRWASHQNTVIDILCHVSIQVLSHFEWSLPAAIDRVDPIVGVAELEDWSRKG